MDSYVIELGCRPRLKYHMDYCASHPEELSKVAGLQKKVEEVKGIMVDNIEQVWILCSQTLTGSIPCEHNAWDCSTSVDNWSRMSCKVPCWRCPWFVAYGTAMWNPAASLLV